MATKVLWTVRVPSLDGLIKRAQGAGVRVVCIRTDYNNFSTAIPRCLSAGIEVWAWRWPATSRQRLMAEADRVKVLAGLGLAGYVVDPEQEPRAIFNWARPGLSELAEEFCAGVKAALGGRRFGVTSHYRAARTWPDLPWGSFIGPSDRCYPQAYWRAMLANGPAPIGKGPDKNYEVALNAWQEAGAVRAEIVPMAGEIALAKPAEIAAYGQAARRNGVAELHFYCDQPTVPAAIWQAIAKL